MSVFSSTGGTVTIPDNGTTSSTINVSGLAGVVTKLTLTLNGLTHTFPDDLDLLLVGPDGTHNLVFMSDAGSAFDLSNLTVTFSDGGLTLPNDSLISAGPYTPANYAGLNGTQPAETGADFGLAGLTVNSAPPTGGATFASAFNGIDPNGTWTLYLHDDAAPDTGSLAGFSLDITTVVPSYFAVGPGAGALPQVSIDYFTDATTFATRNSFLAFNPAFLGGLSLSELGDGRLVVGAANGSTTVSFFDMGTGTTTGSFVPFAGSTVGVDVSWFDTTHLAVGVGAGGGPQVKIYDASNPSSPTETASFFAFSPAFLGGVDVAWLDATHLAVGTASGAAQLTIYDLSGGTQNQTLSTFPFPSFTGGLHLAGSADGHLAVGTASGAGQVKILDAQGTELASFFAFGPTYEGGVDVAWIDLTHLAVTQVSGGSQVAIFDVSGTPTQVNSAPAFVEFSGGAHVANISDLSSIAIGNVSHQEGNSGTTAYTFTVTLDHASFSYVSVNYATVDGTATVAGGDYTATSGTLVFDPGQTSKTITVQVSGDGSIEGDEAFTLNLTGPLNAVLGTTSGTGTVQNDDHAPVVQNTSASTDEDTPLDGQVSASDADNDSLTYSLVGTNGGAQHGTVSLNGSTGAYTYTPATDFNGDDAFGVMVTDVHGNASAQGTVSITVNPVNDAPIANLDNLNSIDEDSAPIAIPFADLLANDSAGPADESGQTLTITGVTNASGGSVEIVGTDVVFTPDPDYNGFASFQYTVTDNGSSNGKPDPQSATGNVSFFINGVDDAPENHVPGAQTVNEDTDLVIDSLSISDVDGAFQYTVTLHVEHGVLHIEGDEPDAIHEQDISGNDTGTVTFTGFESAINRTLAAGLTYRGDPDFNGADTLIMTTDSVPFSGESFAAFTDSFTISGSDTLVAFPDSSPFIAEATGPSDTDTVAITVVSVQDAFDDTLVTNEDQAQTLNVLANDTFSDPAAAITGVTQGAHGAVTIGNNGDVTYTPAANFDGVDHFTYTVTAGGVTETADVDVSIVLPAPPPGAPTDGDFNADHFGDLFVYSDRGESAVWQMREDLRLDSGTNQPFNGPTWHAKAFVDLDPTGGFSDIVWQNDNGQVAVWQMEGVTIVDDANLPNPGAATHVRGAADFDGNIGRDIVLQHDDGHLTLWLMQDATHIAAGGQISIDQNPGAPWKAAVMGDFNGDGQAGILFTSTTGDTAIWEDFAITSPGHGAFALQGNLPSNGPTWHAKGVGDFDGDHKDDILWQNDSGAVSIWLMDGIQVKADYNVAGSAANGPTWHVVDARDMNADGRDDILWQNDNGQVAVWENFLPGPGSGTTATFDTQINIVPELNPTGNLYWHVL